MTKKSLHQISQQQRYRTTENANLILPTNAFALYEKYEYYSWTSGVVAITKF